MLATILPSQRLAALPPKLKLADGECRHVEAQKSFWARAMVHSTAFKEAEKAIEREKKLAPSQEEIANALPFMLIGDEPAESKATLMVGTAPVVAIAASAGLGKTVVSLAEIKIAVEAGFTIGYQVPSTKLGLEVVEKAIEMGIPARLLRGRDQTDTDGEPMCQKAEACNIVAKHGLNVKQTMCISSSRDKEGNLVRHECPFLAQCRYMAQMKKRKGGELIVGSHQYLKVQSDAFKNADIIVCDESFWNSMLAKTTVDLRDFLSMRSIGAGLVKPRKGIKRDALRREEEEYNADLNTGIGSLRQAILAARTENRPLKVGDLRSVGLTEGLCKANKIAEYSRVTPSGIYPDTPVEEAVSLLENLERQSAPKYARVWSVVGSQVASDKSDDADVERMKFLGEKVANRKGVLTIEDNVELLYTARPRYPNVPVLIIDANAEGSILKQYWPQLEMVTIDVEAADTMKFNVVFDKTASKSMMKGERRSDELLRFGKYLGAKYARETAADPERRPVLIVHKSTQDAWVENGDWDENDPYLPHLLHAGEERGLDYMKRAIAIGIACRLEPSVDAVEEMAAQLHGDDVEPLIKIQPDEFGNKHFPREKVILTDKNGRTVEIWVSYHPDPRCDAILRQVRDATITQGIARVRQLRTEGCTAYIMTNVPVGIEPDHYVSWSELVPDQFDEIADGRGFFPENHRDLAECNPDLWTTPEAVRKAWTRRPASFTPGTVEQLTTAAMNNELLSGWVRVEYGRVGSKKTNARICRRHAWVSLDRFGYNEDDIIAAVLKHLPDAVDIIVGPIPVEAFDDIGTNLYELCVAVVPTRTVKGRHKATSAEMTEQDWSESVDLQLAVYRHRLEAEDRDWDERDYESLIRNSKLVSPAVRPALYAAGGCECPF